MSSNTITVNPRKKTARSAPPSRNVNNDNIEKGTVLLRNPLPKYSFEKKYATKKKQTKDTSLDVQSKDTERVTDTSKDTDAVARVTEAVIASSANASVSSSSTTNVPKSSDNSTVPLGRLVNSFPQAMMSPELFQSESQSATQNITKTDCSDVNKAEKPINKVDPFSSSETKTLTHSVSASAIDLQSPLTSSQSTRSSVKSKPVKQTVSATATNSDKQTGLQLAIVEGGTADIEDTSPEAPAQGTSEITADVSKLRRYKEKVKRLEDEKQLLKNQLDVQLQVNQELKKLLVASVGEDLHHRVERLMTERAQMSLELGDFSKKMTEDYEHLDKISIQADMWRSKYLACRVMSDELAASKAFYSMQFQECQMALQQLLNERHELKANLYESYRGLQQVQEAFDPLNTQNASPRTLSSKHIIDLARTNQLLVDRIKYRLLPSHVTSSLSNKMEPDWHDYLTQAEAHAQQLLSRELRPEDFRNLSCSAIMPPNCMAVDRYHPFANYDNLTFNVCCKCKGEICVI